MYACSGVLIHNTTLEVHKKNPSYHGPILVAIFDIQVIDLNSNSKIKWVQTKYPATIFIQIYIDLVKRTPIVAHPYI